MERDPTLVEVVLRLSPDALEACALLVAAEVEAVDDLIGCSRQDGASERFLAELEECRGHWRALQLPLVEAGKRLRNTAAVSGEIDTDKRGRR